MNVNRKSFSYQLFTFFDRNKDKYDSNICQYTRGILAGMFLVLFSIAIGTALSLFMLEPIVSVLAYWITGISFIPFFGYGSEEPFILLAVGTAAWLIITVAFSIYYIVEAVDYARDTLLPKLQKSEDVTVQKSLNTMSVFGEYIKSKHDKICRNISFTTGD